MSVPDDPVVAEKPANVVAFQPRSSALPRVDVPFLNDAERAAIRRLVALEEKIALAIRKLEHLEHNCPTARREIRAMLVGD